MDNIREKLKCLPMQPGVYIMKSADGEVIYVGKSKLLKNRVTQYFTGVHTGKVAAMVSNIRDFEYIVTANETEALVLECNLIKKHKPYYNILLKDSKQYPYIKITKNEKFPKISLARRISKDGAKYYGPYTAAVARDTLDTVRKIFRVHTCNKKFPSDIGKDRPCLNYHIKTCLAPCSGNVSQEQYSAVFDEICMLLDGNTSSVIKKLKSQMEDAAASLEFEKAADLRDKIGRIRQLAEQQNMTTPDSGDRDIIAVVLSESSANVQLMNIRDGKLIGRNSTWISLSLDESPETVMANYVTQYYFENQFIPAEILVNHLPDSHEVISSWLSENAGFKISFKKPLRGTKLELVKMAEDNARRATVDRGKIFEMEIARNKEALENLSEAAGLAMPAHRIESYDISHTRGKNTVGSMVVYEKGVKQPGEYRHFKIKSVSYGDDYGATYEVISRRFYDYNIQKKGFENLPALILADGGLGQVHIIENALEKCNISGVKVLGMVKDDRHQTNMLIDKNGEIIPLSQEAFRLISEIQNEVHRVAVSYHRKLSETELSRSVLDEIPGIGAKRKKALLRAFGSVKAIKNASPAELAEVDGISTAVAEEIFRFFN